MRRETFLYTGEASDVVEIGAPYIIKGVRVGEVVEVSALRVTIRYDPWYVRLFRRWFNDYT